MSLSAPHRSLASHSLFTFHLLPQVFCHNALSGIVHSERLLGCQAHRLAKFAKTHECFIDKATYSVGVLSFGFFCYLLGSSPQEIPNLYCLFFILVVPLRWMYYRAKKWQYYLLDFCYYANAIFVSMLLFFPTDSRLFMLCFSFSEGPLAWALIVWRCSLVFNSIDKIISVFIHLIPGTVFFILRWWDSNILSSADAVEGTSFQTWPVVISIPTLWMWLFFVPLIVYCIWQGLYFLVVEGLQRQQILQDPEMMTSYKELKRKAKRANNIWWYISGLLGDNKRIYMYAIIQGVFTIATLALTVPIFRSYHLHICFEVFKLAATIWNGGRYVFEVMPRLAEKKLTNDREIEVPVGNYCNCKHRDGSTVAKINGLVSKDLYTSNRDANVNCLEVKSLQRLNKEMPNKFSATQQLGVCQLYKRPIHEDDDHQQGDCKDIDRNVDVVQVLRSMLKENNRGDKSLRRVSSIWQRGFGFSRQVACAS